ncbi:hypothetical protein ACFXJJ_21825 [Streptomyces sp. NPDC059233]
MTTTHTAAGLDADVVVGDLSALSAQVGDGILRVGTDDWTRPTMSGMRSESVRYSDVVDR